MQRIALDRNLNAIGDTVAHMGALAVLQIERAVEALVTRRDWLAQRVQVEDEQINRLRYSIESQCLTVIATQQPQARDLRQVLAALYVANELERIADHAAGIAAVTRRIQQLPQSPAELPFLDIRRMQNVACTMLNQALLAFDRTDDQMARDVASRDDEIDALYVQNIRTLLTYMMQDPRMVPGATYVLWIAHDLERIGDRVTNICERVTFAATGEVAEYK